MRQKEYFLCSLTPKMKMKKTDKQLSIDEAYDAMVDYLEGYYNRTGSDDIAMLLGDLLLLEDGTSCDSAAMSDWEESVAKILNQNPRIRPRFELKKEPQKE